MLGMFSLISEPVGAKLLDRTGKSSTPETAKKRYISTTLQMLIWYQCELKPGSEWVNFENIFKCETTFFS